MVFEVPSIYDAAGRLRALMSQVLPVICDEEVSPVGAVTGADTNEVRSVEPVNHPGRPGTGAIAGSPAGEMTTVACTGLWSFRVSIEFVILSVNASSAGALY